MSFIVSEGILFFFNLASPVLSVGIGHSVNVLLSPSLRAGNRCLSIQLILSSSICLLGAGKDRHVHFLPGFVPAQ